MWEQQSGILTNIVNDCCNFWANQPTDVIRPLIIAGIAGHYGDMAIGFANDLTMECSLKVDVKTTLRLQKVGLTFASYLIA